MRVRVRMPLYYRHAVSIPTHGCVLLMLLMLRVLRMLLVVLLLLVMLLLLMMLLFTSCTAVHLLRCYEVRQHYLSSFETVRTAGHSCAWCC